MRPGLLTGLRAAIAFVCALLLAPIALAQKPVCNDGTETAPFAADAMTATLHNVGDTRVLLLAGGFDSDAGSRIPRAVSRTSTYDEVWMCSPGGSVAAGKAIGEALTRAKATVRVPAGYECISACTIAHMGGYVRIIEKGADFVVHASSSYSGWTFDGMVLLDCAGGTADSLCGYLKSMIDDLGLKPCRSVNELKTFSADCMYLTSRPDNRFTQIALSARFFPLIPANEDLLLEVTDRLTKSQISYVADLLQYYQGRLLDGRTDLIFASGYSALRAMHVAALYAPDNAGAYARSLKEDVAALKGASNPLDNQAVWQRILTAMELNVQNQMIDYASGGNVDLGAAGPDAVRIFDAMIICQIQSLCFLEPHQAEALGYVNVFDMQ